MHGSALIGACVELEVALCAKIKKTDALCIRFENGEEIQLLLKTPCAFPLHILKTFLTYLG